MLTSSIRALSDALSDVDELKGFPPGILPLVVDCFPKRKYELFVECSHHKEAREAFIDQAYHYQKEALIKAHEEGKIEEFIRHAFNALSTDDIAQAIDDDSVEFVLLIYTYKLIHAQDFFNQDRALEWAAYFGSIQSVKALVNALSELEELEQKKIKGIALAEVADGFNEVMHPQLAPYTRISWLTRIKKNTLTQFQKARHHEECMDYLLASDSNLNALRDHLIYMRNTKSSFQILARLIQRGVEFPTNYCPGREAETWLSSFVKPQEIQEIAHTLKPAEKRTFYRIALTTGIRTSTDREFFNKIFEYARDVVEEKSIEISPTFLAPSISEKKPAASLEIDKQVFFAILRKYRSQSWRSFCTSIASTAMKELIKLGESSAQTVTSSEIKAAIRKDSRYVTRLTLFDKGAQNRKMTTGTDEVILNLYKAFKLI